MGCHRGDFPGAQKTGASETGEEEVSEKCDIVAGRFERRSKLRRGASRLSARGRG